MEIHVRTGCRHALGHGFLGQVRHAGITAVVNPKGTSEGSETNSGENLSIR